MIYCYASAPYLWRRGEGLCPVSELLRRASECHFQAFTRRYATIIPSDGETMIFDPTTKLTLVSPPAAEPVTLAQAKQFLRIEHSADDTTIGQAISAARQAAEHYLRLLLLPQSWTFETSCLHHITTLPVGPAQEITEIEAFDSEGESTTLDADGYRLTLDGHGLIFSNPPSAERFAVHFDAGFAADVDAVPAAIKQGMLHHIVAILEHRGSSVALPSQSIQCYQPYRRVRL